MGWAGGCPTQCGTRLGEGFGCITGYGSNSSVRAGELSGLRLAQGTLVECVHLRGTLFCSPHRPAVFVTLASWEVAGADLES